MNKRLLDVDEMCTIVCFPVEPDFELCEAQDAKTLKAVGEAMTWINKSCEGDAQYYNAMRHFEEDLKQGRMPE